MTLGEQIRQARFKLGKTQQELADMLDLKCGNTYISKIENNGSDLSVSKLKLLSQLSGCSFVISEDSCERG